jgi:hypothetical protein
MLLWKLSRQPLKVIDEYVRRIRITTFDLRQKKLFINNNGIACRINMHDEAAAGQCR